MHRFPRVQLPDSNVSRNPSLQKKHCRPFGQSSCNCQPFKADNLVAQASEGVHYRHFQNIQTIRHPSSDMKKETRRIVDTVVISDVHLGTYGCHAKELVNYLRSIRPKRLVLNGDIIDIWQFSKSYFPPAHMKVVKELMKHLSKGVQVYYIPGNHDEMLRKFVGQRMGNLIIENKVVLDMDGRKTWIFHGDVFDVSMRHSKWIAKLGGFGYDMLILFNRAVNHVLEKMGREKVSLSKKVKDSVKAAIAHVNDFENTVSEIGIDNGYDHVICGHIHRPEITTITTSKGSIEYMNSGDWVENLTALEYSAGEWTLYVHDDRKFQQEEASRESDVMLELTATQMYAELLTEFNITARA